MPTPDELLAQELARQQTEWGTYVCGPQPIYVGGARAFNPGDPVPVSHVTNGIVQSDQVSQASTSQEPPAASNTNNAAENGN